MPEDANPEATWEAEFLFWFKRPATFPAMVAQVVACPLDHVFRYPVLAVIHEAAVNSHDQWAVGHSYWCTTIHNFYHFMSFFFPQEDRFRYTTSTHSQADDLRNMATMAWYVYRFFVSQSVPLGLHFCELLYLTGHTPTMIQSLHVDNRFLPTINDSEGNIPHNQRYEHTWNVADYEIPADAQERRNFPLPPGMIPEGAQNPDFEYWHCNPGDSMVNTPVHRHRSETTYLLSDGDLSSLRHRKG